MSDSASPLMLRRRLRTELKIARLNKELTQEQVAKAMEWSLSKMNRIEKAKSGISINDLKALLSLYGITDKERTEELLALARAVARAGTARQSSWWKSYSDVAPPELLELIDYESAASCISQFETMFVPGILQTEEYASAVLQVFYDEKSAAERVAALVDLRTRRRDLLLGENAPKFSFVLDESVIHRLVGGSATTSQQLRHLISVAELPNVTIRIVPFAAGIHPGMKGPFELIQFAEAPDENIVFREITSGDNISDDPTVTQNYLESFGRITGVSLKPSDSVDRLRRAAERDGMIDKSP
jgi:transcriptional regulator with XRE-family HTH domain